MNRTLRIIIYAALATSTLVFALLFQSVYSKAEQSVALPDEGVSTPGTARTRSSRTGQIMTYGGLAFFCFVGLAVFAARDLSKFLANRAENFLYSDDGEGLRTPEYEQAEEIWASGKHLEAIQLMREYLKKHPREIHASLRIAEIYEKDLGNFLAAALEYEEVIQHNLPPERWGWAAIHLANLYNGKLNKPEQATELLKRIVNEFGQTAAARKARERLIAQGAITDAPPPDAPLSNLPPGFSPLNKND